jgi:endonuclease YncB( thermonuclease family)
MRILIFLLCLFGEAYAGEIYWSDGDSGRLDGVKFRLANVDAPESGSSGNPAGAKCERARAKGYEAKTYMVELTCVGEVEIERDYGEDRYGRLVADLIANGADPAAACVRSGYLKRWPFKDGQALAPKPDWCP